MDRCSESAEDETFSEMLKELRYVSDWFFLGIRLGVPRERLMVIDASYHPNQLTRKVAGVLDAWFKSGDEPSWGKLVQALHEVPDHECIVRRIMENPKYFPVHDDFNDSQRSGCKYAGIPRHVLPVSRLKTRDVGEATDHRVPVPIEVVSDTTPPVSLYPSVVNFPHSHHLLMPPLQNIMPPTLPDGLYRSSSPSVPSPLRSPRSIAIPTPPYTTSEPSCQGAATVHPYDLMAGERIVNISNIQDDSQSYISSISRQKTHPNSLTCGKNGQMQVIPRNNPLSFAGFNPSPNPPSPPHRSGGKLHEADLKHEVTARRELERLVFGFKDLLIVIEEHFVKKRVRGKELKTYLERLVSGADVSETYESLKQDLSTLPQSPLLKEVFESLSKSLHYDNYTLLYYLVDRFLPHSNASSLIDKHERNLKNFEEWCPSEFFAKAHGNVFPTKHHLSDSSVAVHLNDDWQIRPISNIRSFQRRELCQYISEDSFRIVHVEKRSIFVIWETSIGAVEKLSVCFWERFCHLRSQGVLQLFVGRMELDFSGRRPKVYRIEPVINKRSSFLDHSVMNLQFDEQSHMTFESGKTGCSSGGDSGYTSVGTPPSSGMQMREPPPSTTHTLSDSVLEKFPYIEVQFNYRAPPNNKDHIMNVEKGQKVKSLADENGWTYVVNEQKQYGYIPSRALPRKPMIGLSSSPIFRRSPIPTYMNKESLLEDCSSNCSLAISDSTNDATPPLTVAVVRREVDLQNENNGCNTLPSPTQSERLRPDTPPSVANLEALRVSLSSNRNTVMAEENVPEVSAKREKKKVKSILKDAESKSLTKSLRLDLKALQLDDGQEIQPTLFKRLQQFFSRKRERKDSISTKTEQVVSAEYASVHFLDSGSGVFLTANENSTVCLV